MSMQASTAPIGSNAEIDALLKDVAAEGQNLTNGQAGARERLLEKAVSLTNSLRSPTEALLWVIWAEPTRWATTRLAFELDIFATLAADGGRPKSTEELIKPTGAAPLLVTRTLRHLGAMGMLDQTAPAEWAPNATTKVFADPYSKEAMISITDGGGMGFAKLTEFYVKNNFQISKDTTNSAFEYAMGMTFFEYLHANPKIGSAFNTYMAGMWDILPFWSDFYPVEEKLIEGLDTNGDASALVDVGGNIGHVSATFIAKNPGYKGRVIVQDQAHVIADRIGKTLGESRIEFMAHDFFQPQPIKGARAYFMRWIIHDWPDEMAKKLLVNLRQAMTPGYSRILINDHALSNVGAPWEQTALDIYTMQLASAQERTKQEWRDLAASAGLRVTGIYEKVPGSLAVIEMMI